jgi:uncharacterized repeat protein (TIGR01451 family)
MKSFNILKKGMLIGILALAMASFGLYGKGVPANTWIISTNAWATYTNLSLSTGFVTNNTNSALSNMVLAVFGFSNYSATYDTLTNSVVAGSTYYYPIWLTNHGNSTNALTVSAGSNYVGTFGSAWLMSYVDTNSNNTVPPFNNPTNLAPDAAFGYMVRVVVDPAADDGSIMQISLSNTMAGAGPWGYPSTSNGMVFYGGTNLFTNLISLKVGGPRLILSKSYTVTNLELASAQVVPGSILTFSIAYTNIGSGGATNVAINDFINTTYLQYLCNSTNTIAGASVAWEANSVGGWTYAQVDADAPTVGFGSVNTNVTGIRYSIPSVGASNTASSYGTIVYKVVVR